MHCLSISVWIFTIEVLVYLGQKCASNRFTCIISSEYKRTMNFKFTCASSGYRLTTTIQVFSSPRLNDATDLFLQMVSDFCTLNYEHYNLATMLLTEVNPSWKTKIVKQLHDWVKDTICVSSLTHGKRQNTFHIHCRFQVSATFLFVPFLTYTTCKSVGWLTPKNQRFAHIISMAKVFSSTLTRSNFEWQSQNWIPHASSSNDFSY